MGWSQRTLGETALETGLLMMGAAHGTNRESAPGSGTASQWPQAETEDQHDKREFGVGRLVRKQLGEISGRPLFRTFPRSPGEEPGIDSRVATGGV